jgi:hypothetical protein
MSTNKILLAAALIAGFAGSAMAADDVADKPADKAAAEKPAMKSGKVAEKPCPAPVKKHRKAAPKPVHHAPVHQHHEPKGLTVTLGGELDTQFGYRKQKSTYDTVQPGVTPAAADVDKLHKFAIVNDTRIHVKAEGHAHGFKYGGKIVLNSDTSDNKYGWNPYSGMTVEGVDSNQNNKVGFETKVWVRNQWGHLEAGSTTGAYQALRVNAANYARATGGIDGDAQYWWNPLLFNNQAGTSVWAPEAFIINPNLPSNYVHGLDANAAKVSYFTPSYYGFKLGVSYTPDSEQRGSVSKTQSVFRNRALTPSLTGYKNVWEGGLRYKGQFDKIGIRASLMGNAGDAKDYQSTGATGRVARDDLRAWEAGLALSYMGFTLAGSYADLDDSGTPKTLADGTTPLTGKDDSNFWNIGLSYEHQAFAASVNYMESRRAPTVVRNGNIGMLNAIRVADSSNKFSNLSFGVDYKLAPGFMPYAEVSRFSMKEGRSDTAARYKNSGFVVLAGTKLHF